MPVSAYFKGRGDEVMRSIREAHPDYDTKRVKSEFYATANKTGMKPKSKSKNKIGSNSGLRKGNTKRMSKV